VTRRSQKYDDAYAAIRVLVNEADPIGLIEGGAPEDEYDLEVNDLVRLVLRADPFEQKDVDAVWVRWFGDTYRTARTTKRSRALTAALRELQSRFAASP
jgi:hypothetical protein